VPETETNEQGGKNRKISTETTRADAASYSENAKAEDTHYKKTKTKFTNTNAWT
jgi:hypothetical protein